MFWFLHNLYPLLQLYLAAYMLSQWFPHSGVYVSCDLYDMWHQLQKLLVACFNNFNNHLPLCFDLIPWNNSPLHGSFSLRPYHQTQVHIVQPELKSFGQFHLSSNIISELCFGDVHHTWCNGHSPVWSLRITTVLGKFPLMYPLLFIIKLRITTVIVLACLCVHILTTCPSGVSLKVGVALS